MKTFSITIPTPCQQPWEQMQVQEKGRYCSSCQKTVIDFTNSSDNEIIQYMISHPATCGRFQNLQLQKTYSYTARTTTFIKRRWFYFIGFLYAELISPYSKAGNGQLVKPDTYLTEKAEDEKHLIKGTVTNEKGEAVPFVNVVIRASGRFAVTNANGNFSIQASANDVMVVSYLGYKAREIIVGTQTQMNILLEEDVKVLDEVVATGYHQMKRTDLTGGSVQITVISDKAVKKRSFFKRLFGIK